MENIENLMSLEKSNPIQSVSPASQNLIQLLKQPEPLEAFHALLSFDQVKQITNFIKEFSNSISELEESSEKLNEFLSEQDTSISAENNEAFSAEIAIEDKDDNQLNENKATTDIDIQKNFLKKPTIRQKAKEENDTTYNSLISDFTKTYNNFTDLLDQNEEINALNPLRESIYSLENIYEETLSNFDIEKSEESNHLKIIDEESSTNEYSGSDFNIYLSQLTQTLSLIEQRTSEFALSLANVNMMGTTLYSPNSPPTFLNDLMGVGLYIDLYL
jgi:chromosome segregation ATPase